MPYRICLNPHYNIMARYFVFCEGDTEVLYVEMLRSFYRLPIHIIAKKNTEQKTSLSSNDCVKRLATF